MNTRRAALAIALLLPLFASACASTTTRTAQMDAVTLYEQGQYAAAYEEAAKRAENATGDRAERARLIAGLSAQAMGQPRDAERWLGPLLTSPNRQIRARALATVGLIELETRRYEQAAAHLSQAATLLSGDARAQAGLNAGDAYAALGRPDAARLQYRRAYSATRNDNLRAAITDRLERSGFTIQLGAFARRMNAERAAENAVAIADRLGLGAPEVVVSTDAQGRTLYLVQLGRFQSRDEAERIRTDLGLSSIIASAPID